RQVGSGQREAVEEAARVGVRLGVEEAMRVGVPAQELLQAQGVGAVRRTDDDDAAVHVADQADAAQDERAHDDLADVGLARDEAAEVRALDAQQPARLAGAGADENLPIVEEVELARELALAQDDEDLALVATAAHDGVLVAQDDQLDAGLGQDRTGYRRIEARPAGAALELGVRREERQVAAGADEAPLAVLLVERAGPRVLGAF